jgi:hypothetical protein
MAFYITSSSVHLLQFLKLLEREFFIEVAAFESLAKKEVESCC